MSDGALPPPEAVRAVRRELVGAESRKIAQVVAMVDALPSRGQADALIAPLRPRLAQMHLPRPLNLPRLLFTPLDPVLMPATEWRRGTPGMPRTVLAPLAAIVRQAMGAEAAALDARLARRTVSETQILLAEGRRLWPGAARVLGAATMPEGWVAQTGLAPADFPPITKIAQTVLAAAVPLQEAASGAASRGTEEQVLAAALCTPDATDAATATLIAVILARLPGAEARLDSIEQGAATALRGGIGRARAQGVAFVLDRLESAPSLAGSLLQAADGVERDAMLLHELTERARSNPALRSRVQEVRRTMDASCRERFQAALDKDLVAPEAGGPAAGSADDAVAALERAASALHRFGHAAGRIGSAEFYDRAIRAAVARVAGAQSASLSPADRARMVELLLGSEAAHAMLRGARPA